MRRAIFTFLFWLLFVQWASAATYWVSPTGTNPSCATIAASGPTTTVAKSTIAAGIACLSSGDTLYIRSGTYDESVQSFAYSIPSNITIQGYSGDSALSAIFRGIDLSFGSGVNNVTFNNIVIDAQDVLNSVCVFVGSAALTIQNSILRNCGALGIETGAGSSGHTLRNVEITHIGYNESANPPHPANTGYGAYSSSTNTTYDNVTVHDTTGYGLQIYYSGCTNCTDGTIVKNSLIYHTATNPAEGSGAILISSGSGLQIYNTIVYDGTQGITADYDCAACIIYSNTVYGLSGLGISLGGSVTNASVKNNIVYNNGSKISNSSINATIDHNLCESSGNCGSNPVIGNPLFTNPGAGNFTLQAGSPAIDHGVNLGSPYNTDYAGISRPQGAGWDIGAYEYVTPPAQQLAYWVNQQASGQHCVQSATDPGPGSSSQTIAQGINCMSGGDTLYIRGGTYNTKIDPANGAFPQGTSWSNAPVIAAYNNETVTVPGINVYGSYFYIIFQGLTVDGNYDISDAIWISGGAGYIKFDNITVMHSGAQGGIHLPSQGVGHNWFVNCNIHDNGLSSIFDHGMYISTPGNIIENSQIHDNAAYGITLYNGGTTSVADNIIRFNKIYNNGVSSSQTTAGIGLGDGDYNAAYGNLVSGNWGGIQVGVSAQINGSIVYNNTLYANAHWAIALESSSNLAHVKNNILWGNSPDAISDNGTNTDAALNLNTDPQFLSTTVSSDDFLKPAGGSPAINAGADLGSDFNTDYAGNARGYGGAWDIGAYEFVGEGAPPTPPSLVAAFSFDEGSGTTAADSSGLNNNGNLQAGASWDNNGKYGKAISLSGAADSYVEIPYDSSINLNPNGMTLEAWVKPSQAISGFKAVISRSNQGPYYWLYAGSASYLCSSLAAVGGFAATLNNAACDDTSLSTTNWTYIAVTYDGKALRYYRNGLPINTVTATENMPTDTSTLRIGASGYLGEEFSGLIDEVRVYNYARTQSQIQSDMNTPISGAPAGPEAPTVKLNPATSLKVSANNSVKVGVP